MRHPREFIGGCPTRPAPCHCRVLAHLLTPTCSRPLARCWCGGNQERAETDAARVQERHQTDIQDDARLIEQLQTRLRDCEQRNQDTLRELAEAKEHVKVKASSEGEVATMYREQLAFQRQECERLRQQLTELATRGVVRNAQRQPSTRNQSTGPQQVGGASAGAGAGDHDRSDDNQRASDAGGSPTPLAVKGTQTEVDATKMSSLLQHATSAAASDADLEGHHRQISSLHHRVSQLQRELDAALGRESKLRGTIARLEAEGSKLATVAQSFADGELSPTILVSQAEVDHRASLVDAGVLQHGGSGVGAAASSAGDTDKARPGATSAVSQSASSAPELLRAMKSRYEESVRQLRSVFTVSCAGGGRCFVGGLRQCTRVVTHVLYCRARRKPCANASSA